MDMPKVKQCDITNCSYNEGGMCHALAITVGDGKNPHCDTFCDAGHKGGDSESTAGVGACKVESCIFNTSLECQASGIKVGKRQNDVDCLTFREA